MKPGSLIQLAWHSSQEGAEIFKCILQPNTLKRRQFGLLEKPNFPANIDEVNYKIYVSSSKPGIGRTSTINKLAGIEISQTYYETAGINVTAIYWPVKLLQSSKVIMFRLEFWDAGETSERKFGHVLPSCKEQMAATMFLFSFTDKSTLDSLQDLILSNAFSAPNDDVCPIIVGTRYDLNTLVDVAMREVQEFEQKWKVPVIRTKNVQLKNPSKFQQKAEFAEVALSLDIICEQLWARYQKM